MKSFFFIPATLYAKIDTILETHVDQIIIDFEDAISKDEDRVHLLKQVLKHRKSCEFWYRIPLRKDFNSPIKEDFLEIVVKGGVQKFVLPKLITYSEFFQVIQLIKNYVDKPEICILIEHPRLNIELTKILESELSDKLVTMIGLGLEDFMEVLGNEKDHSINEFIRNQVFLNAKAYNKKCIDIASMNISDQQKYNLELHQGMTLGMDGKFLIHPIQWKWMQNYDVIKQKQLNWAYSIINSLPNGMDNDVEIQPYLLNGEVIEKPHIIKAKKIIEKYATK